MFNIPLFVFFVDKWNTFLLKFYEFFVCDFVICIFFVKQSSLDEKDARDERNKKLLRSAKEKINELTGNKYIYTFIM